MIDLLFAGPLNKRVSKRLALQQAPEAEQRRRRMVRSQGSNLRRRRCTNAAEDGCAHRETSRMMRDVQSQSGRFGEVVTQGGQ